MSKMKFIRKVLKIAVFKSRPYHSQVKLQKRLFKNALLRKKRVILALDIFLDIFCPFFSVSEMKMSIAKL